MAESSTYSHTDIQRYLQQQMTRQEMHAFERAIMDDPFLSDALDGYIKANEPITKHHLVDIKRQITEAKEEGKVVAMPFKKQNWWAAAAIVLVIISGGALSYNYLRQNINEINSAPAFAQKQQLENKVSTDTLSITENDIATLKQYPQQDLAINKKRSTFPLDKTGPSASNNQSLPQSSPLAMSAKQEAYDDLASNRSMASAPSTHGEELKKEIRELSRAETEKTFFGKVTDTSGQPVANATIMARNLKPGTTTDAKGNFSIKASDSVVDVSVSLVGYEQATAKLKSDKPSNNIALRQNNADLSEVVVTGYGGQKKKSFTGAAISSSAPIGGWEAYHDYIDKSIQTLKNAGNKHGAEDVVVEFLLDNKGRPANIKIPPGVAKDQAEKIIEILQKGPRWNSKDKNASIKYTFKFK